MLGLSTVDIRIHPGIISPQTGHLMILLETTHWLVPCVAVNMSWNQVAGPSGRGLRHIGLKSHVLNHSWYANSIRVETYHWWSPMVFLTLFSYRNRFYLRHSPAQFWVPIPTTKRPTTPTFLNHINPFFSSYNSKPCSGVPSCGIHQ
jgi:hypothetical protein